MTPDRLAYSTNAFIRYRLDEALRAIAALGYAGVEILCDRPHWFPGRTTDGEARAVAALLGELGLGVGNLNANTANGYYSPPPPENTFEPALSNPDPALRRWRIAYTTSALRLARSVGARSVSVTSGRPLPGCPIEQGQDLFVDSLRQVCKVAEDLDVCVGIEYEPGLIIERATEAAAVIRAVDSPMLGVNLDIGHAYLAGEDPAETVALLAGRIWNVHVEDIRDGKHFHLPPGQGDMPFSDYFEALSRHAYDGFLTVELYSFPDCPVEVGRESLARLRRLLQK